MEKKYNHRQTEITDGNIRYISPAASHKDISFIRIIHQIYTFRDMIFQLTKREILSRYKGTILGLIWPFVHPLITLTVYFFVFGTIFKAPWRAGQDGSASYALVLFCGFVPWLLFAEAIGAAPSVIISKPTYVKKMLFPLEILPIIHVTSSCIYSAPALFVLLAGCIVQQIHFSYTIILIPFIYIPLYFFILALTYILSSISIFIKDVQQIVTASLQILFFGTPIIYPLSSVPSPFKEILLLNPLTIIITQFKDCILYDTLPDIKLYIITLAISIILSHICYLFFMTLRRRFADVM